MFLRSFVTVRAYVRLIKKKHHKEGQENPWTKRENETFWKTKKITEMAD